MIVRSWNERASIQTVVMKNLCVWMRFNAKANKYIYYTDIGADITGVITNQITCYPVIHMENLYTFHILVMKK
jgi:hypothetical protein